MADRPEVMERTRSAVREGLRHIDEGIHLPAAAPAMPGPLVPQPGQQTRAVGQRALRPDSRCHGLGLTQYIDDLVLPVRPRAAYFSTRTK